MGAPKTYYSPPPVVGGIVLNPPRGWLSIIKPIARRNLVTNPSGETNTTNISNSGGSTTIARSTEQQYHGAYSFKCTLDTSANGDDDGLIYGASTGLSVTSGSVYAASIKFRATTPGIGFKLAVGTSATALLVSKSFVSTGRWQWLWVVYKEAATATNRQMFLLRDGSSRGGAGTIRNAPFYVDGLQFELCETDNYWPTTYIDGDQEPLLTGQFPPAYGWEGARHASASYRTGQTRDGGRVMNLDAFKFAITRLKGLGVSKQSHIVQGGALSDGATYQTSVVTSRGIEVDGLFGTSTPMDYRLSRQALGEALNIDVTTPRQPFALLYQEYDNLTPVGDVGKVICSYQDGFGKDQESVINESLGLVLSQWLPQIVGGDSGTAFSQSSTVGGYVVGPTVSYRNSAGVWSLLDTGGGNVQSIDRAPDGTYLLGGDFTSIGGVAANRVARYNPFTNTFTALGSGITGGAAPIVECVKVAPDGKVYVCGDFTTAGGGAATRIAVWDGSTWAALSTGLNDIGQDMTFDSSGNLYVTGDFTLAGGVANTVRIAKWSGSAWTALSTGLNNFGRAIVCGLDGTTIYVTGTFTTAGGVSATRAAYWNGTTFVAMGSGLSADPWYRALEVAPNGTIFAGGSFVTAGGVTVNGVSQWNGTGWVPLGSGVSGGTATVLALTFGFDGLMYVGGVFTAASGLSLADSFAGWNGTSWILPDIDLPGQSSIIAFGAGTQGDLLVASSQVSGGNAIASNPQTATSVGTAKAYPTFIITGPTSSTSRLHQIRSYTTGQILSFTLTIFANEVIKISTGPGDVTILSSVRGDISRFFLVGSSLELSLLKGSNTVAILVTGGTVTIDVIWPKLFHSVDDLTY